MLKGAVRRSAVLAWSQLYRMSEAEHGWVKRMPGLLAQHCPQWPIAETVGIDVGASLGVYVLAMSPWCRRVIALEPNRELCRHLRDLQIPSLDVVEAAAGANAGEAWIVDAGSGWRHPEAKMVDSASGWSWAQPCQVTSLSALLTNETPLVIKIDVEGREEDVVRGLGRYLDSPFVCFIMEIEQRHNANPARIFSLLADHGFLALQLRRGRLVAASAGDVAENASRTGGRFSRLRGINNNYIFLRGTGLTAERLGLC